jgi:16S rRNA (guanine966-N2)-methyltransferase
VFDLVFLDPPYDFANSDLLTVLLALKDLLSQYATVVVERSDRTEDLEKLDWLELVLDKTFGSTKVFIYKKI